MANHPDATFPLAPALTTSGSLRDAPPLVLAAASAAKELAVPRGGQRGEGAGCAARLGG